MRVTNHLLTGMILQVGWGFRAGNRCPVAVVWPSHQDLKDSEVTYERFGGESRLGWADLGQVVGSEHLGAVIFFGFPPSQKKRWLSSGGEFSSHYEKKMKRAFGV